MRYRNFIDFSCSMTSEQCSMPPRTVERHRLTRRSKAKPFHPLFHCRPAVTDPTTSAAGTGAPIHLLPHPGSSFLTEKFMDPLGASLGMEPYPKFLCLRRSIFPSPNSQQYNQLSFRRTFLPPAGGKNAIFFKKHRAPWSA